jgi:DNA-binding SARP family transcriptional activator
MIDLRVLGPVQMAGPPDAVVDAVLVQPKRLALLAYLALSPEPLVSRDRLLALLWPESDERRAREALRQALRFLRRSLGADLLVTRGRGWVGVNREALECDAWLFDRHLSAGELPLALDLYAGELLQGLELRGVPAFEQWLSAARQECVRRASGAAWDLAESAREDGDTERALSYAWRARQIAPADEEGLRRLMGLMLWAGDRAGALRAYEAFETWFLAEFDAVPSVRTRELASRARGPVGEVLEPDREAADEAVPPLDGGADAKAGADEQPAAGWAGFRRFISSPRRVAATVLVAAGLLVAGVTSSWLVAAGHNDGKSVGAERERAVVLPFNVDQADPSLAFLRHGMVGLLGAVFTGAIGPEVVPAPATRRQGDGSAADPVASARRARARWIVKGEVMGNDREVRLSASVRDVTGTLPPVSAAVAGPADSVYGLARELGSRMLAQHLGMRADEATRLGRTPPAALHAYLLGQRALKQARYEEADRRFREALRHDSLFAPPAVGLVETHLAAPWVRGHVSELALPLAFRLLDRLGPAEREFVMAAAGPRYPQGSTHMEYYQSWERAVAKAPDRASVWNQWGDALFHGGPFLGLPNHRERAKAAFEQALALDPDYLIPLTHLIELAAEAGDAPRARLLLDRLITGSRPDEPVNADYLRWRVALASGDSVALGRLSARLADMTVSSLNDIMRTAVLLGEGLEQADRIAELDLTRWTTPAEHWTLLARFHAHALIRGRPTLARRLADAMRDVAPFGGHHLHSHIRAALGAGGDPAAAREAAAQLEARVNLGRVSEEARRPGLEADVCALEVWKLFQGDTSAARRAIQWLRDTTLHGEEDAGRERCAVFLEALLTRHERPEALEAAIARVQVLADQGVQLPGAGFEPLWLFLAKSAEEIGDLDGALNVVRRRSSSPFMLPTLLRMEGRLAAAMGDTAAARRAYAHYLALRQDPEPSLRAEMLEVIQAYRELTGEPTG